MVAHPLVVFIFALANIAISLGYITLAVKVIPMVRVRSRLTKIGGAGFFIMGALAHLDLALTAIFHDERTIGVMATSAHTLAIHVPQMICVWLFVIGLYVEIDRWGVQSSRRH